MWGFEAQHRIRSSHILVINFSSVGAEIVKNLVLGGLGFLTIIDSGKILEQDLSGNFFFDVSLLGCTKLDSAVKERIQELNPRVDIVTDSGAWAEKSQAWFNQFDIIICTQFDASQIESISLISRSLNIPLYVVDTHGLYGMIFVDLIDHSSHLRLARNPIRRKPGRSSSVREIVRVEEMTENDVEYEDCLIQNHYTPFNNILEKPKLKEFFRNKKKLNKIDSTLVVLLGCLKIPSSYNYPIETVQVTRFELLEFANDVARRLGLTILDLNDLILQDIANQFCCEFQPVAAILAGCLSQDVINMLSKRENPINNLLIFNGKKAEMPIYTI
ncbi:BA75_02320T0 [Komagataella pastoris]|uniref:Ubiquitin-like 1-activating enzyme E1A n=1 Tax=Komagataella pastoris TaxID=4922 RepID=A0A1B2JAL6_PICPA|nr:BA75_02320T0 [Komagataella pastoris]